MITIKFRCWDKISDEIKYPKQIHCEHDEIIFDTDNEMIANDWRKFGDCVIMQFIGLKDKNRIEIYEGDIVFSNEIKGVVKFSHQLAGFYIEYEQVPFRGIFTRRFNCTFGDGENYLDETIEVKGNIYQSPELLKS